LGYKYRTLPSVHISFLRTFHFFWKKKKRKYFDMKKPSPPEIHQVHISIGTGGHELVKDHEPEISFYAKEQEVLERNLLSLCPANLWPKGSHNSMSPRPILVTKEHQVHLAELHGALTTAITDIVDRWWTDEAACFPQRMPLEKKEEDLLRVGFQSAKSSNWDYPAC
jgi:hypothetical protein